MSLTSPQKNFLLEHFRKETLLSLSSTEHLHGKDVAITLAEAMLEACALYLHGSVGPKQAFEIFDKRTESIGGLLIEQAARNQ